MNPIEEKIKVILIDKLALKPEEISLEANLKEDIGLDSLDAVELVMEIEKEFSISIPDEEAERFRTIGDIILFVEKETAFGKRPVQ